MINNEKEYVAFSAVWFKTYPRLKKIDNAFVLPLNLTTGLVFYGLCHAHCYYTACEVSGKRTCQLGDREEGFVTNKNKFVNREEAFIIAVKQNQILDLNNTRGKTLYSEDIF